MANHPSALKRHRQSLKRRVHNRAVSTRLRRVVRAAREAMASASGEAGDLVKLAESLLDRAASKNVVPAKRASRLKARLARALNKRPEPQAAE